MDVTGDTTLLGTEEIISSCDFYNERSIYSIINSSRKCLRIVLNCSTTKSSIDTELGLIFESYISNYINSNLMSDNALTGGRNFQIPIAHRCMDEIYDGLRGLIEFNPFVYVTYIFEWVISLLKKFFNKPSMIKIDILLALDLPENCYACSVLFKLLDLCIDPYLLPYSDMLQKELKFCFNAIITCNSSSIDWLLCYLLKPSKYVWKIIFHLTLFMVKKRNNFPFQIDGIIRLIIEFNGETLKDNNYQIMLVSFLQMFCNQKPLCLHDFNFSSSFLFLQESSKIYFSDEFYKKEILKNLNIEKYPKYFCNLIMIIVSVWENMTFLTESVILNVLLWLKTENNLRTSIDLVKKSAFIESIDIVQMVVKCMNKSLGCDLLVAKFILSVTIDDKFYKLKPTLNEIIIEYLASERFSYGSLPHSNLLRFSCVEIDSLIKWVDDAEPHELYFLRELFMIRILAISRNNLTWFNVLMERLVTPIDCDDENGSFHEEHLSFIQRKRYAFAKSFINTSLSINSNFIFTAIQKVFGKLNNQKNIDFSRVKMFFEFLLDVLSYTYSSLLYSFMIKELSNSCKTLLFISLRYHKNFPSYVLVVQDLLKFHILKGYIVPCNLDSCSIVLFSVNFILESYKEVCNFERISWLVEFIRSWISFNIHMLPLFIRKIVRFMCQKVNYESFISNKRKRSRYVKGDQSLLNLLKNKTSVKECDEIIHDNNDLRVTFCINLLLDLLTTVERDIRLSDSLRLYIITTIIECWDQYGYSHGREWPAWKKLPLDKQKDVQIYIEFQNNPFLPKLLTLVSQSEITIKDVIPILEPLFSICLQKWYECSERKPPTAKLKEETITLLNFMSRSCILPVHKYVLKRLFKIMSLHETFDLLVIIMQFLKKVSSFVSRGISNTEVYEDATVLYLLHKEHELVIQFEYLKQGFCEIMMNNIENTQDLYFLVMNENFV